jgi:hypothetical protein
MAAARFRNTCSLSAAGGRHSLGLRQAEIRGGSIVAWGYNECGQSNVPGPNTGFTAVACGPRNVVAIIGYPYGDLNCDRDVDFGDINPFVLALVDPTFCGKLFPGCNITNADINADGAVSFGDINPFVRLLAGP